MRHRNLMSLSLAAFMLAVAGSSVAAGEIEIGEPVERNGMNIGAVYLQAVVMEPNMPMLGGPGDIHLEADIRALEGYQHGLDEGDWVPYLSVSYHLRKEGADWSATGSFVPMVANDGPHYGDNVKLDGPAKYRLSYRISPPIVNGFFRHTDKETAVPEWWAPFEVHWVFTYVGTGKKGGY